MSASIYSLPAVILQLVPPGYRVWQLLRLTCTTLNTRLGDYHEAREVQYMYIENNIPMSRRAFVDLLIAAMNDCNTPYARLTMTIGWPRWYWSSMTWDDIYLGVYGDDGQPVVVLAHPVLRSTQVEHYVAVGKMLYRPIVLESCTIEHALTAIYHELPELHNRMTTVEL